MTGVHEVSNIHRHRPSSIPDERRVCVASVNAQGRVTTVAYAHSTGATNRVRTARHSGDSEALVSTDVSSPPLSV